MKYKLIIDPSHEEEVIIYVHQKNELTSSIIELIDKKVIINGYYEDEIYKINVNEISVFFIENTKTYAYINSDKILVKYRLCELENILNDNFIKINQSCIINKKYIKKFSSSLFGSLMVEMKNGYSDYVSRRNLKIVKERLGL